LRGTRASGENVNGTDRGSDTDCSHVVWEQLRVYYGNDPGEAQRQAREDGLKVVVFSNFLNVLSTIRTKLEFVAVEFRVFGYRTFAS
jgi:hypothetical protein